MMQQHKYIYLLLLFIMTTWSCKQGPKIISTPVSGNEQSDKASTGIFSNSNTLPQDDPSIGTTSIGTTSTGMHKVTIKEVLPTERYVYLHVDEEGDQYWIATAKKPVKEGEVYFYKSGILKTNFESKEHNRVFDKVYLVSNIVAANHGNEMGNQAATTEDKTAPILNTDVNVEGSIKIADIVASPKQYAGKTIQVSGVCTKLNPNIMGRNWIHLKDGSKDEYDFVITSDQAIPEGHQVTMTGDVVLDKDFGAGYKYEILVENGKMVSAE